MKILIAEDDAPVREMLCAFISELGHEVTPTENGQELVKLAMAERPDLIVTDMHMPGMTCDSMISMIEMYSPLSGIPIIIVTGATKSELADSGISKGIPIIAKPVDFDQLAAEINKVVQKLGGNQYVRKIFPNF
ncbi:MAG: response regulator [Elusimicrobia bacterium]|nr:response regulator [Elusimicrobiota bacterium]